MPSRRRLLKLTAIILKRRPFRDHDWQFTAFSDQQGKLSFLARGVRRLYSKRLASLSIFNQVDLILNVSRSAKYYSLSEVGLINDYLYLKKRLPNLTHVWHGIELIDKLFPENQASPQSFALTTAWLDLVNQPRSHISDAQVSLVTKALVIKLINQSGFWSDRANTHSKKLTASLAWLVNSDFDQLARQRLTQEQIKYLSIIDQYLAESEVKLFNRPIQARQLLSPL